MAIWNIVSPFVAAALAAFLAFHFGVRQRRHDLVLTERFNAFKALNKVLTGIIQYCDALAHPGDDLGPSVEALPGDVPRSILLHAHALEHALAEFGVFVGPVPKHRIYALVAQLSMAASMELACAAARDVPSDKSVYDKISTGAKTCIDGMYQELGLPK